MLVAGFLNNLSFYLRERHVSPPFNSVGLIYQSQIVNKLLNYNIYTYVTIISIVSWWPSARKRNWNFHLYSYTCRIRDRYFELCSNKPRSLIVPSFHEDRLFTSLLKIFAILPFNYERFVYWLQRCKKTKFWHGFSAWESSDFSVGMEFQFLVRKKSKVSLVDRMANYPKLLSCVSVRIFVLIQWRVAIYHQLENCVSALHYVPNYAFLHFS